MGAQMDLGLTGSLPRPPTQLRGWPTYLIHNATANLFQLSSVISSRHQCNQIVVSDIGIVLWFAVPVHWSTAGCFAEMVPIYGVLYL